MSNSDSRPPKCVVLRFAGAATFWGAHEFFSRFQAIHWLKSLLTLTRSSPNTRPETAFGNPSSGTAFLKPALFARQRRKK